MAFGAFHRLAHEEDSFNSTGGTAWSNITRPRTNTNGRVATPGCDFVPIPDRARRNQAAKALRKHVTPPIQPFAAAIPHGARTPGAKTKPRGYGDSPPTSTSPGRRDFNQRDQPAGEMEWDLAASMQPGSMALGNRLKCISGSGINNLWREPTHSSYRPPDAAYPQPHRSMVAAPTAVSVGAAGGVAPSSLTACSAVRGQPLLSMTRERGAAHAVASQNVLLMTRSPPPGHGGGHKADELLISRQGGVEFLPAEHQFGSTRRSLERQAAAGMGSAGHLVPCGSLAGTAMGRSASELSRVALRASRLSPTPDMGGARDAGMMPMPMTAAGPAGAGGGRPHTTSPTGRNMLSGAASVSGGGSAGRGASSSSSSRPASAAAFGGSGSFGGTHETERSGTSGMGVSMSMSAGGTGGTVGFASTGGGAATTNQSEFAQSAGNTQRGALNYSPIRRQPRPSKRQQMQAEDTDLVDSLNYFN
jgi:hypothetical protein